MCSLAKHIVFAVLSGSRQSHLAVCNGPAGVRMQGVKSWANVHFPSLFTAGWWGGATNVLVNVSPSATTEGPSALCLVGFLPSTLSKRFFLLGSGKRTQRTAHTVRNHGSESFVAEETVESDALNLASRTKVQSLLKTRFGESDHVRKSEEICGQITQQPPASRI